MNVNAELPLNPPNVATQVDWEQWSSNWTWRAVQCLVELPDFNSSPKWIAQRLNINVEKAVEALEGLERLGCIKKSENTFVKVDGWFQITPNQLNPVRLMSAYSMITPQIISKLQPTDAYTSQFIVGDMSLIKKYSPRFISLFKEMESEAKARNCTDIIATQMSFVQLTGSQEEGAQ